VLRRAAAFSLGRRAQPQEPSRSRPAARHVARRQGAGDPELPAGAGGCVLCI